MITVQTNPIRFLIESNVTPPTNLLLLPYHSPTFFSWLPRSHHAVVNCYANCIIV